MSYYTQTTTPPPQLLLPYPKRSFTLLVLVSGHKFPYLLPVTDFSVFLPCTSLSTVTSSPPSFWSVSFPVQFIKPQIRFYSLFVKLTNLFSDCTLQFKINFLLFFSNKVVTVSLRHVGSKLSLFHLPKTTESNKRSTSTVVELDPSIVTFIFVQPNTLQILHFSRPDLYQINL